MAAVTAEPPLARETAPARFDRVLAALADGRGAVVEITGEPGAGKTGLADALAERAVRRALPVTRARTRPGTADPLQALREAGLGTPARAGGPLRGGFAARGGREPAGDGTEWAAGGVLVLDDVHRCDPAAVPSLVRLIRAAARTPYVLVLAHRPRQCGAALAETLEDALRAGDVTRLEPAPLDPAGVAALLARGAATGRTGPGGTAKGAGSGEPGEGFGLGEPRGPGRPHEQPYGDDELAERLCAAADGNPLYLRLLLAARWEPGQWPDRPGTDTHGLLREAKPLLAEFDALTPRAATALSAAAVLGAPFRPEDVARVCGLGLEEGLDALAELERADLVRPADFNGRLTFRHLVVGHVAHERAGLSFRLRAHRRALDLITARGGGAVARARHAEHLLGTDTALATRTLAEGAAEAAGHRPATAERWLRLALTHLGDGSADRPDTDDDCGGPGAHAGTGEGGARPVGTGPVPAPDRTELEVARCRALIAAGRPAEARALAHEVLGHRRATLTARQSLRVHAVCAEAERQLGRYEEATALSGAALALIPRPLPADLPPEAVELITVHGLAHVLRGTHEEARAVLREAAAPAATGHPAADTPEHAVVSVLSALCATHVGDLAEAEPEITRCARLVDALPDPLAGRTPETLALLGSAELYLERYPDAVRHLGRGLPAGVSGVHRPVLMHRQLALAMAEQWTGRLDTARRRAHEAEELARSLGAAPAVTLAQAIGATALVWSRGRAHAEEAVARIEVATRTVPPGQSWWTSSAMGLLALARLHAGDPAGCRRTLLDGGGGEGVPLVRPFTRPYVLALLATATLDGGLGGDGGGIGGGTGSDAGDGREAGDGSRDEAERLVRAAEAAAERLGLPVQEAHVRCARARLHAADGEHEAAARLFASAAETFRARDMPVQYAWTLVSGARSLGESRGRAAALRDLDIAEAVARTFGARLVLEEAALVRADLVENGRLAQGLDLLSDREREIAELAAAGLRSRQIAERLFLSPRTVETHLSRVYRKLDVSSRVALSAYLRGPG
ncbi:LuxR C-terminal-related transcriptional regulator [Streptomyces sp. NPDC091281]|uniref:helix-turn-helix transcriptional regulator n=1 Tax=Streptomyces sp. NPDC091281 TaxID=3365985 RepID=UPI003802710E